MLSTASFLSSFLSLFFFFFFFGWEYFLEKLYYLHFLVKTFMFDWRLGVLFSGLMLISLALSQYMTSSCHFLCTVYAIQKGNIPQIHQLYIPPATHF